MLRTKQILIRAIVLGAGVFNLLACGQTGSLYLPARTAPVKKPVGTEAAPTAPPSAPARSG